MPKIKTNRAAAKRFRVTASGKIKRNKGYQTSHSLEQEQETKKTFAAVNDGGRG